MKKIFFFTLIISILLMGISTPAQTNEDVGNINGYIFKKDGNTPESGISVELQRIIRSENDKKIEFKEKYLSNKTGNDGMWELKNLPVGEFMVKIKKGNRTIKLRKVDFFVKIYKGRTIQFSFTLLK